VEELRPIFRQVSVHERARRERREVGWEGSCRLPVSPASSGPAALQTSPPRAVAEQRPSLLCVCPPPFLLCLCVCSVSPLLLPGTGITTILFRLACPQHPVLALAGWGGQRGARVLRLPMPLCARCLCWPAVSDGAVPAWNIRHKPRRRTRFVAFRQPLTKIVVLVPLPHDTGLT
jgi:hypothetical protein